RRHHRPTAEAARRYVPPAATGRRPAGDRTRSEGGTQGPGKSARPGQGGWPRRAQRPPARPARPAGAPAAGPQGAGCAAARTAWRRRGFNGARRAGAARRQPAKRRRPGDQGAGAAAPGRPRHGPADAEPDALTLRLQRPAQRARSHGTAAAAHRRYRPRGDGEDSGRDRRATRARDPGGAAPASGRDHAAAAGAGVSGAAARALLIPGSAPTTVLRKQRTRLASRDSCLPEPHETWSARAWTAWTAWPP